MKNYFNSVERLKQDIETGKKFPDSNYGKNLEENLLYLEKANNMIEEAKSFSEEDLANLGRFIIKRFIEKEGKTWETGMLSIKQKDGELVWAFEDPGCGCCSGGDIISSANTFKDLINE